ncbi:hypothetical protein [Nocardioides sp. KR10-350]|uniref:hypothetical protein n=1 Tax=Nocardioides cheoyonin TaxID=3156615 RepID=UPI0032B3126F
MTRRAPHFRPPAYSAARPGLVRPIAIDADGKAGPTPRQARGSGWRRTSHGLYVPADIDGDDPAQRVLEAAQLIPAFDAPGYGGVTGWAAFAWYGARWFDGFDDRGHRLPVTLAVINHRIRPQPGITVTAERFLPREFSVLDGVPLTDPVTSIGYEVRHSDDLRTAVKWLAMAAYSDLVSIAEMKAYAAGLNGWTGIPQLRKAMSLASENSWSPTEVDAQLIWMLDLGLPSVLCNQPIFDLDGRHIGTPDLLDPTAGLIGEYDGALHFEGKQRRKDLDREADFRRVGLEYVTMVAADRRNPAAFMRRTLDARARAMARTGPRRWTIDPPAWWTPVTTVAQRRALSADQRARLLQGRAA